MKIAAANLPEDHLQVSSTMSDSPRDPSGVVTVAIAGNNARYVNLRTKFVLALSIAIAWTALSIRLSLPWLHELGAVTSLAFAIVVIAFIAYVPGFMNAFLLSTLMLDRKPARRTPASYPAITILVAAYNESTAIRDTLESLSRQDYPGRFEVLVLNDGSTDDTGRSRGAIHTRVAAPSKRIDQSRRFQTESRQVRGPE